MDEEAPYPLNTGKRIRTYNLISRLAAKYDITYLCRGIMPVPRDRTEIRMVTVGTAVQKKSGLTFYAKLLQNLASPLPYIVTSHNSNDFEAKTRELALNSDVIHCEWTPYAWNMRQLFPCASVLSTHNVEAQI